MTKLGNLEFRNALLCEDVRQEKNNKFIIIGVFVNDIVLSEMPGQVPISFFIEARAKELGEYLLTFRISGPGKDSTQFKIGLLFHDTKGIVPIPGPKLEVRMAEAGIFKVDASLDDKKWVNLISKAVSIDPSIAQSHVSKESRRDSRES